MCCIRDTCGSNLNTMQSSPYLSSQYSCKGRKEEGKWKPRDTKASACSKTPPTYKPKSFNFSWNVRLAVTTFTSEHWLPSSSTLPAQQGDPHMHRKLSVALGTSELCKKSTRDTLSSLPETQAHRHVGTYLPLIQGLKNLSVVSQEACDRARIESRPTFTCLCVGFNKLGLISKGINNLTTISWIGTASKSKLSYLNHPRNAEIVLILRPTVVTAKVK